MTSLYLRRHLPRPWGGATVNTPAANTEMTNLHLAETSTQVAKVAHAILVCEGAGWHRQGDHLALLNNITLLHLPPFSPEPNPMENVWQYLRQNKLASRVWETKR